MKPKFFIPIVAIVFLVAVQSCNKSTVLSEEVHGVVIEKTFGNPLPYAQVFLEKNIISDDGEFFVTTAELQADENGRFSFRRDGGHEFVSAEVPGYLHGPRYRESIGPEENLTIELTGIAWIKIQVHNVGETSPEDHLRIWPRFIDQPPFPSQYFGEDVQEELIGMIRANEPWDIRWLVNEEDEFVWHTVQTAAFVGDTVNVSVAY